MIPCKILYFQPFIEWKKMLTFTNQIEYELKVLPSLYSQSLSFATSKTSTRGFYSLVLDYFRIEVLHPSCLKVCFISFFVGHTSIKFVFNNQNLKFFHTKNFKSWAYYNWKNVAKQESHISFISKYSKLFSREGFHLDFRYPHHASSNLLLNHCKCSLLPLCVCLIVPLTSYCFLRKLLAT